MSSTLVQLLLWLISGADPWTLLLRDARLTAALAMGRGVLPPGTFGIGILLVAAVIHLSLSLLYAALLLPVARLAIRQAWLAGAGFGAVLYIVNLYGFAVLFPWFVAARGGIALAAHIVFGLTVVAVYRVSDVRCRAVVH